MSKKKQIQEAGEYTQMDIASWAAAGYLTEEQKEIIMHPDPEDFLRGREPKAPLQSEEE